MSINIFEMLDHDPMLNGDSPKSTQRSTSLEHGKRQVLLATIESTVDLAIFRNYQANVDGKVKDVLEDGLLSCAAHTSHVLLGNELISKPYATVTSFLEELGRAPWYRLGGEMFPGAVLLWALKRGNLHVGFCVQGERGALEAVSNCSICRYPHRHEIFHEPHGRGPRDVEGVFWHPALGDPSL